MKRQPKFDYPQIVLNFRKTNVGYQYISDRELIEQQLFSQKHQLNINKQYNQPHQFPKRESIIQLPKNLIPQAKLENILPQQFQLPPEKVDIFPGISLAESFPLKPAEVTNEKQQIDAYIDQLAQEKLNKLEQEKLEKIEKERQEQELQQRQQQLLEKQTVHLVPSCAHWFSFDSIHEIERKELPEFFIDAATEKQYKQFRNYMIKQYRQSPRIYMTTTQCRRKLVGDVQKIIKVHAFLEHWGLINFNAQIPQEKEGVSMFLPEMYKPTSNYLPYCKFANIEESQDTFDFYQSKEDLFQTNKEGKEVFSTVRMLTKNLRPLCDFCGIVCDLMWYESKLPQSSNPNQPLNATETNNNAPDMFICVKCYSENKYPSIMSAQDFYKCDVFQKIETNPELSNQTSNLVQQFYKLQISIIQNWSSEETLKLLELIQKFNDDWVAIETEFNSGNELKKTKEQLLYHFLELPMKNISSFNISPVQQKQQKKNEMMSEGMNVDAEQLQKSEIQKYIDQEPTVFADTTNPILMHVALFKNYLDKIKLEKEQQQPKQEISEKIEEEKEKEIPTKEQQFANNMENLFTLNEDQKGSVIQLEEETKNNAKMLQEKEEHKITELVNFLIDIQLTKLDLKLSYLEEYEKIIWYEKTQLEVYQRNSLAERVSLAYKRNELTKEPPINQEESAMILSPRKCFYQKIEEQIEEKEKQEEALRQLEQQQQQQEIKEEEQLLKVEQMNDPMVEKEQVHPNQEQVMEIEQPPSSQKSEAKMPNLFFTSQSPSMHE